MEANSQIVLYQEKVQEDPLDVLAWQQLGDLYNEVGEQQKAAHCYQKVLRLQPGNVAVLVNLQQLGYSAGVNKAAEDKDSAFEEVKTVLNPVTWFAGEIPIVYQVLIAFICFLITLILASTQQWSVTDLIWSLWITSLTLGYTYLLSTIAINAIHQGMSSPEFKLPTPLSVLQRSDVRWIGALLGALLTFLFFTVHFGMFHFVHSLFLNSFFPIVPQSEQFFSNVFIFIQISLSRYWPVILLSMVAQFRIFQQIATNAGQNNLMQPYKNVVKMHISILLFAGLSTAQLGEIFMPYLLILYFFPFGAIFNYFRNRRQKPTMAVGS